VGRAELSKRQDWTCEASFHIYPLFEALMCYTIKTLLLEPSKHPTRFHFGSNGNGYLISEPE
jgi:hypothetical protein